MPDVSVTLTPEARAFLLRGRREVRWADAYERAAAAAVAGGSVPREP